MEKVSLPSNVQRPRPRGRRDRFAAICILSLFAYSCLVFTYKWSTGAPKALNLPLHAAEILEKCRLLDTIPGPPPDFNSRTESDRYAPGTKPTLIKNATIWTGRVSGLEVIKGDLLLDKGLIQAVGSLDASVLNAYSDLVTVDVAGAWVTPGIIDLHSHLGVFSAPSLAGSADTNSIKGLVQPWLRSLDALNTHDDAYRLSISGGLTTVVVLPGSANAIGGQAFVIKLRPTAERSPSSMLLEPPHSINASAFDPSIPPRWRQMKQACGENPSRVYSGTRMDTIWAFRNGYETARKIKVKQDEYCAKAQQGKWDGDFPEDLQWEMLVDVLRGRVKIHNHCYEAVDLDGIVRLTNEFNFSIAAFHHAHETYLVPDLLKKQYGHPPAVALFATNARYKRESYRGSEFAPRILDDNGLNVVMKSDHPVLNSRHLVYEAQQAHYYGLPDNKALASVTTTPAIVMGQDHRIGYIKTGYDADIVVWDSHPLALGATPKQVYIDGIPQLTHPFTAEKPASFQRAPKTPNFDKEAEDALKYDGLPPLEPRGAVANVLFTNVSSVYLRSGAAVREVFSASSVRGSGVVAVRNGEVVCSGEEDACSQDLDLNVERINLEGGSIAPGLVSYGSPLGLSHIIAESSTTDGIVVGPLAAKIPTILGGDGAIIRAVDGLMYGSRDALLAYRSGVTSAITPPHAYGFLHGLSTAFSTGSAHKLEHGALIQNIAALHIGISMGSSLSVSTQIAALRRLLLGGGEGDLGLQFGKVTKGEIPLVVDVESADIIASLIQLKDEVEQANGSSLKLTLSGASEAHLLAKQLGEAGVGVILTSPRPFPGSWESKRILPGRPLSKDNAISLLLAANVTVGIGIAEAWGARSTRFELAWAAIEANGDISKTDALALASVNLETLLGVKAETGDLVVTKGGSVFDFEAKVIGIVSPIRGVVDLI